DDQPRHHDYPLSLHDALPIYRRQVLLSLTEQGRKALDIAPEGAHAQFHQQFLALEDWEQSMLIASLQRVAAMLGDDDPAVAAVLDRKSTRLNSSHVKTSYAVF